MSISSDSSDEEIIADPEPVVEPKKKRAYVRKTPQTIEAKEKQVLQLQKAREARKKPESKPKIDKPVKEKPVKEKPVKEKPVKEKPVKSVKENPVEVHHHHYPKDIPKPKSVAMTFA